MVHVSIRQLPTWHDDRGTLSSVAVLRLPNPGSDLDRFVSTFALIAREAESRHFDLDFMTNVMTMHFQASSMGAHGEEAVRLSTRDDRTRDPLFNQSKMYSELYRMLGWIRSTLASHSTFTVTPLGATVMHYHFSAGAETKGLVAESFISVVFPNPSTTNVGIVNHRPFAQLLKLAYFLGGEITRDEMIIGVLSVTNDLKPNTIEDNVQIILQLRQKNKQAASKLVNEIADKNNLQVNTLENYTRLPVAILGSEFLGWGKGVYSNTTYAGREKIKVIQLTETGISKAKAITKSKDLRMTSLAKVSRDERAWLSLYGYYAMALRAGIADQEVLSMLEISNAKIHMLLKSCKISTPELLIFNPSLQEEDDVLLRASEIA